MLYTFSCPSCQLCYFPLHKKHLLPKEEKKRIGQEQASTERAPTTTDEEPLLFIFGGQN